MCTVSMMMDGWRDQFPQRYPNWVAPITPFMPTPVTPDGARIDPGVSRAEFDKLKAEVEELKKLILAAKKFDEATGQPHCEAEDKTAFVKKLAEMLGVDMKGVFE